MQFPDMEGNNPPCFYCEEPMRPKEKGDFTRAELMGGRYFPEEFDYYICPACGRSGAVLKEKKKEKGCA